jgi:diaminopimelate decarboxylase
MSKNKQLENIIKKYKNKTPFYLCDRNIIREQINKLQSAFSSYDNFELLYAVKANYSDAVLKEIFKLKIGAAVSSPEELKKVQKYGIKPISYVAPYTPKTIIQLAKNNKIELNYNNYSELQNNQINNSGIRINPEVGWSFIKDFRAGAKDSQFGISYKYVTDFDLSMVTRLHMHTSSDSYKINIFILGLKRLLAIASKLPKVNTINIGGGIAVPLEITEKDFNIKKYALEIIKVVKKFNKQYNRNVKIQIEPGSYIVRPSTYYISKVKAIEKKNNNITYYYLDGTKHHLKGLVNIQKLNFITKSNKKTNAKIFGCTCQRSDIIYNNSKIPNLKIDDLVVIPMTGAYCLVQSDNFHLLQKPNKYYFN